MSPERSEFEPDVLHQWESLRKVYAKERQRTRTNKPRTKELRSKGKKDWLAETERLVDKVHSDIERAILFSETAVFHDGAMMDDMLHVFSSGLHLLACHNDVLDETVPAGLDSALLIFSVVLVGQEAKRLKLNLESLQKKLTTAVRDLREAEAKLVINLLIDGILLVTGPVGWIAAGGIFVVQVGMDTYLGPPNSTLASAGNVSNDAMSLLSNGIAYTDKMADRSLAAQVVGLPGVKTGGKAVGRATPVFGLMFDACEVFNAYGIHAKLVEDIERTEKELRAFKRTVRQNRPNLDKYMTGIRIWESKVAALLKTSQDAHRDLDAAMNSTGYRPL